MEKNLGNNIEWYLLENKKASIIGINNSLDFNDEKSWEQMFGWFAETANKFKHVFYNLIQDYEKHQE